MRKLYYKQIIYTVVLKNGKKLVCPGSSSLHYGIVPKNFSKTETDINIPASLFVGKVFTSFEEYTFKTKNFQEYIYEYKYREIDCPQVFTFNDLMRRLPSTEFIQYCRDNSLSLCVK